MFVAVSVLNTLITMKLVLQRNQEKQTQYDQELPVCLLNFHVFVLNFQTVKEIIIIFGCKTASGNKGMNSKTEHAYKNLKNSMVCARIVKLYKIQEKATSHSALWFIDSYAQTSNISYEIIYPSIVIFFVVLYFVSGDLLQIINNANFSQVSNWSNP